MLRALHPRGDCALPVPPLSTTPPDLLAVDPVALAQLLKHRVDNGSAPGPSGWTGSHLQLLMDSGDKDAVSGPCMLTKDLSNGVFTGSMQQRLLACVLQPRCSWIRDAVPTFSPSPYFVALASALPELDPRCSAQCNATVRPSAIARTQRATRVDRAGGGADELGCVRLSRCQVSPLSPSLPSCLPHPLLLLLEWLLLLPRP